MVWKLPRNIVKEQPGSQWATELTDEVMDRVCRGNLKSTYQHDYLGIPQGKLLKSTYQHDYLGIPQGKLLKSTYHISI